MQVEVADTDRAGDAQTATQDGVRASRRYRVVLENRLTRDVTHEIVITESGYRPAWVEARRLARLGQIEVAGERLEAGGWTVVDVTALDKPVKKADAVSAVDLVKEAYSRGLEVSPSLVALLVELQPESAAALVPVESDLAVAA
jgi:hypothetical protein